MKITIHYEQLELLGNGTAQLLEQEQNLKTKTKTKSKSKSKLFNTKTALVISGVWGYARSISQ